MASKIPPNFKIVADNRKARFNYEIGETFEAGIELKGTEVKSLRAGKATIGDSYADEHGGEIFLVNASIPEYLQANQFNHETKRPRKLLLHKRHLYRAQIRAALMQLNCVTGKALALLSHQVRLGIKKLAQAWDPL